MTKIKVKGAIVSNDDADIYDWLGYDCVSPSQVENALDNDTDEQIQVDINSGGGSVFAASEIYSMLSAYSGKVTVNIQGLAASAASVIAMAGDEVNISPTAQMMIHKASTVAMGNADDLAHDSKMMDSTDQSIINAYEAKTGMNRDDILQMMANETWMTAQEAVDKGFADNVSAGTKTSKVVNSISTPLINSDAIAKIKTLMAKARDAKPNNKVEMPENNDTKPTPSLKDEKLAILLGKKE
ncbi:head maturation protease, ClpP-related [Limosilactobacillus reuteri]|uniref:head maturation protease, ClpP-related n=1 Tax=Limosilactobacillus reuteri TaxID=1598 RepID=UPI00081C03DC|nr:head maturation protease, ClpP-related [Limosilactobacillus reuteri]MCH5379836.1 Clp protease ClpP [Limosilactobacillus reuteri]OCW63662.1 peptidase [Limosilactobacillus reuteri]OCW65686.1 peptidase [Limosilactobacillus reuteri]OCW66041.1 peptidase [Limosilactobacillus reuteri]OCW68870.1 peptidase [Limosilactobacillus reuteri]